MMRLRHLAALGLALGLLPGLAACGQPAAPEGADEPAAAASPSVEAMAATATPEDHIAWYEGDVESAFAEAKASGKPLFLYWGAVWCPPCYYLKHTVFQRPEVMGEIEKFIPVYLDGDDKSAQVWGEKFDVKGYPTTILFTPEGEEFMRMPSALEADRYAEILNQALGTMRPVKEAYAAAMAAEAGAVEPGDLKLLAYYAWDQDSQLALEDADKLAAFKALWEKTPESMPLEKSRFFFRYLTEAINQHDAESEDPVFPPEEAASLASTLAAAMADPEQTRVNLSDLLYMSREMVGALYPEAGPEREAFVEKYVALMRQVQDNESLAYEQRIDAFYPELELYRLQHPAEGDAEVSFPPELTTRIQERITAANEAVTDPELRQSLFSDLSWILQEAGLDSEAEAMLKSGMEQTEAPYYFMSDMADVIEKADRKPEAIEWYKRAYESTDADAEGGMTRFRWGYTYLRSLLRLAPEDAATVEAESKRVLGELLTHDDAFALGNKDRLNSLSTALMTWNEDGAHEATITALRDFVAAECGKFPAEGEDSQQSRCQAFLAPEEKASE